MNHVGPEALRDCTSAPSGSYLKNRLTQMQSSASKTSYTSYDALGRVTGSKQWTNGTFYPFTYSYANSLLDAPASMTYPSLRSVTMSYDNAGKATGVSGASSYATVNGFAPNGAAKQVTLGNTLVETTGYNGRLQPTSLQVGTLLTLGYDYGTASNNGNVRTQSISRGGFSATQVYFYDKVNRLQLAAENPASSTAPVCPDASGAWCEKYGYDGYGNRSIIARSTNLTPPTVEPASFNTATNRNAGTNWPASYYDSAGNVTQDATGAAYQYDGENRQVRASASAGTATYVYDGDGRRVARNTPDGAQII